MGTVQAPYPDGGIRTRAGWWELEENSVGVGLEERGTDSVCKHEESQVC